MNSEREHVFMNARTLFTDRQVCVRPAAAADAVRVAFSPRAEVRGQELGDALGGHPGLMRRNLSQRARGSDFGGGGSQTRSAPEARQKRARRLRFSYFLIRSAAPQHFEYQDF